jgi:methionyl aminopeptidase
MMTLVKTETEIAAMRTSGHILGQVLSSLEAATKAGITTKALADLAASETKKLGGGTPILGFEGFPEVICISVNDEVVHGIPGPRVLKDGDLCTFDFCVSYQGMITDSAITVPVGKIDGDAQRLLVNTRQSLADAIRICRAGIHIEDISRAVEKRLKGAGLGIVEALCGHGVGHLIHEDPEIPNFDTGYPGIELKAGMTLAIEPMATLGQKAVKLAPDHWTYRTSDGSLSAQFEHTILIGPQGAEILTLAK